MKVGNTDFFFARETINLEGQDLECVVIKSSADEEMEYIALDSLDDEGYMRGGLAEATLKWMYKKAKKPYIYFEPYQQRLSAVIHLYAESEPRKGTDGEAK